MTLVSKEHVNSSAHLGTRAAFPTFDLEIREHVDRKLSYWCELITVDSVTQKKISAESVRWKPVGPFVDFAASAAGVERRGRCSIDELNNFSEKEYQVLFYSDLGPKSIGEETLLGFFWVRRKWLKKNFNCFNFYFFVCQLIELLNLSLKQSLTGPLLFMELTLTIPILKLSPHLNRI